MYSCLFFFNDTATTEIYTLSLHDALPISSDNVLIVGSGSREHAIGWKISQSKHVGKIYFAPGNGGTSENLDIKHNRSEEHTSELQSRQYLVCRLLLEKKKT